MRVERYDRMHRRRSEPPVPQEVVPPDDAVVVLKCPACGVARLGNWRHQCSTRGEPRKECRACRAVWAISPDGATMRRVR
jgi:hypothetical protein